MSTSDDFIDLGDRRLRIRRLTPGQGDGFERTTLVFLHEGLGCIALWRDVPARCCERLGFPAIVYDRSIGGARSRINRATGVLSSDEALADQIVYMLDHYAEFTPRAWALEHTGSTIATRVLDDAIRSIRMAAGARYSEPIVQKTNSPNLAYKDPGIRAKFHADYEFVLSCRRQPVPAREAVA